ncbi:MAG TPA: hypothetical protein VF006_26900 [Longimicrobium sp.]
MNTILDPSRHARTGVLILLMAGLVGCGALGRDLGGLGTDIGAGAVRGARGQLSSDSTQAAIRLLTGAATSGLASGITDRLQPAIDTTLAGAFGRTRAFLGTTQDSLALFVGGPLSASVERLIRGNVQTLGTQLNGQLDPLVARMGHGLRTELALTLGQAGTDARQVLIPLVGEAIDSASVRLAVNARGPLRQAIDSIVSSAVQSGVKAAETSSKPFLNRITGALMGVVGAVVLGLLAWMHIDRRRSKQALFAMAEAIKTTDDDQARETIKDRVKASARRHQVDGYLHTFLEKNQLLRGSEQPARVAVPRIVRGDAAEAPPTVGAGEPPRM